jgi:hypothetical protein
MKHLNIRKHNNQYDVPMYVLRELFDGKSKIWNRKTKMWRTIIGYLNPVIITKDDV